MQLRYGIIYSIISITLVKLKIVVQIVVQIMPSKILNIKTGDQFMGIIYAAISVTSVKTEGSVSIQAISGAKVVKVLPYFMPLSQN